MKLAYNLIILLLIQFNQMLFKDIIFITFIYLFLKYINPLIEHIHIMY